MTWERAAMALIVEALGGPPAARIAADCAALPSRSGGLESLVVSFVGQAPRPAEREALLAGARQALAPGGRLVLIDHNRPRRLPAALVALVRRPRVPGATPRARWRRLAHPVAREAARAGFAIEALRFVAGERVQVVLARRH